MTPRSRPPRDGPADRAPAPRSEAELFERAQELSGSTLEEVAQRFSLPVPDDLRRAKGWVGGLMERALGATAASRSAPDFEGIGVELKTLPVDPTGYPCESTFVCTIPLEEVGEIEWPASRVCRKLSRVLWVVVEGAREIPVARRRLGSPLLWSPSPEEEAALRFDWEELAGVIGRGDVESVTGHMGRFLQVRPKAANSRARRRSIDADGRFFATLPRGFYLRPAFTARILKRHFALPR